MTTSQKIEEMKVCGISYTFFEKKLSVSRTQLWQKVKGESSFKEHEVVEVERLYQLFLQM